MAIQLLELATYFIIYSFLGWVLESIFRSFCEKKIINTGFLRSNMPYIWMWAIIMILFLKNFSNSKILLFAMSIIFLSLWEYIVGVILEKLFF